MDVAAAIQRSDPDAAHAAMRAIMTRTMAELSELHSSGVAPSPGGAASHGGLPG
jgi:DNA-binding FadR family transcriptional regulator